MGTEPTAFAITDGDMENDTGSGVDYDAYDEFCPKSWVREFSQTYEPSLFLLIFILGAVGNMLVVLLYSVLRNRLKTMTDVYLLNLAVADLLFLATLPFWAVNATQGWAFGTHAVGLCKVVVAIYKLNFFSSMLLLTCISADRYMAIVQVTRVHNLRRHKRMLYSWVTCLGVWLLSCLLALPDVLFAQVKYVSVDLSTCDLLRLTETWIKVLVLSLQVAVGFVLPLVVMTVCYSFILRALLQARSFHKHKALRVILAVVVVFVLSQLPYNGYLILLVLQAATRSITDCEVVKNLDVFGQVAKSLAYMHACINPFLYVFVGVRFRRDLLAVLHGGWASARGLGAGASGKALVIVKRPSVMSDTETMAGLSL